VLTRAGRRGRIAGAALRFRVRAPRHPQHCTLALWRLTTFTVSNSFSAFICYGCRAATRFTLSHGRLVVAGCAADMLLN